MPRLSGAEDLLPITVSERLMDDTPLTIGSKLALDGQLRSYNKVIEGAGRLLITGFAQHLVDPDSDENPNQVQLTGALCKLPSYRTTPFGREIADLMLAVNRAYGKSDYIPCITWGRTARFASHLKVGDKVALEPGITCGHCEFCKSGRYNLCPDVVFLATPPVQGCNEDYITFPADMCFKLPEGMSTKEGALIEPFAVGLHAAHQGKVGMGDQCIILGSGCIGLMTLLACKACGATDITVVDMAQKRLDYAMKLGATRVINAKEKDVLKEVEAFTNGVGIEKVFETAGSPVTIAQTPYLVKKGGTITLVGMAADPEVKFNFGQIMAKEARIESVFRYRNLYAKAISAVANGIDIGMVATHEFDFEHIQEAYEAAINDKENVVKAVIKL